MSSRTQDPGQSVIKSISDVSCKKLSSKPVDHLELVKSWLGSMDTPVKLHQRQSASASQLSLLSSSARKQIYRGHPIIMQGLLYKRGQINVAYKCRLFILTEDGYLHYLISEGWKLYPGLKVHAYECTHKNSIRIGKDSEIENSGVELGLYTISIRVNQQGHFGASSRMYRIAAHTAHEHYLWMNALQEVQMRMLDAQGDEILREDEGG